MQGVTTGLILFILACFAYPKLIKNKPQFYIAFALVVVIIFLDALSFVVTAGGQHTGAFAVFLYFAVAILQILVLVALVLCTGGIELHELAGDMHTAYRFIRHGDEEKPIIVPRTGEMPKEKEEPTAPAAETLSESQAPDAKIPLE